MRSADSLSTTAGSPVTIGLLERPAADQRDAEGFEVLRRDLSDADRRMMRARDRLAGRRRSMFVHRAPWRPRRRRRIAQRGGHRTRRRPRACEQLFEERGPVRERRVPGAAEFGGQRDDTLGVEAERHADHVPQASQQQRGASEQRQRQRDLRGDQRKPDARPRARR